MRKYIFKGLFVFALGITNNNLEAMNSMGETETFLGEEKTQNKPKIDLDNLALEIKNPQFLKMFNKLDKKEQEIIIRKLLDLLLGNGGGINESKIEILSKLSVIIGNFSKKIDSKFKNYSASLFLSFLIKNIDNNLYHREIRELTDNYRRDIKILIENYYKFNKNNNEEKINFLDGQRRDRFLYGHMWLYDALTAYYTCYKSQKTPLTEEELKSVVKYLLPTTDATEFLKIIFTDLPGTEIEAYVDKDINKSETHNIKEIIYNQQKYDEGMTDMPADGTLISDVPIKIGKPLAILAEEKIKDTSLESEIEVIQEIPIGYTIFLPKGEVKGVLVNVYGGVQIKDRKDSVFQLNIYDRFKNLLLQKGIVYLELNLIDLLKLDVSQMHMSKDLQTELHGSIHKFFTILKEDPHLIHEDLELSKMTKLFLHGESFGGMTAIRHAELYPNTFNGYISHDGGLSGIMMKLSDTVEPKRPTLNPWLTPLDEDLQEAKHRGERLFEKDPKVMFIQEPVLLLHNFDDNNVNIKVTLDFYKEMINADKKGLTQLLITKQGNPMKSDKNDKGHFLSKKEEAFKWYGDTIASFVIEGPSKFPMASKWMAHQYDIYANKNYKAATLQERFISEAFRIYKSPYHILDVLRKEKDTKNLISSYNKEPFDSHFEQDWEVFYKPLFFLLSYEETLQGKLQAEANFLINSGDMTQERIGGALLLFLPPFINYIKEKYFVKVRNDIDWSILSQDGKIQEVYKDNLRRLGFYPFYISNLDLWERRLAQLISEGKFKVDKKELADAKENLRLKLQEDQDLFKDVVTENILVQNNPGGF